MTWLPICLFLVLFANYAKLESDFNDRLPRDVETTTAADPTAPSSTQPSSSAAPSSAEPSSAEPSSTEPSSTEPSSSAAPSSTEPSSSAAPSSTQPSSSTEPSPPASSSATESPKEDNKKDGDECDANSINNIVCENDKLKFCGPDNKIMSVQCVVKGKQGFCNCEKTACVAQKPVCPDDKTKCYQPNTKLPDNLDCHKFTYCNQNNEKLTLQCPQNLIYDMTEEKCVDRRSARCHKVACPRPGKGLQLIPFPQAKNYYVLCYSGIGDVRKCPDTFHAVRDNKCEFDCNLKGASGLFKDTNLKNCRNGIYYACKRSGSKYVSIKMNCPKGMTFDEDIEFCTKEDMCKEEEPENQ